MLELTAEQTDKFAVLLASALNEAELERCVKRSTGDGLYIRWVGRGQPLLDTITRLLEALQNAGLVGPFLAAVYKMRPNREDVRLEIAVVYPDVVNDSALSGPAFSVQKRGIRVGDRDAEAAFVPGLQRNIRPRLKSITQLRGWVEGLLATQRSVCRVELAGRPAGSGFLVGPDVVLTNWHVVEKAAALNRVGDLTCRFDCVARSDGTRDEGTVVPLGSEGLIHHRPYAPAELTAAPATPPPVATELDFALLRLASPFGNQETEGRPRGWIVLPVEPLGLQTGDPLIIVQHPDGGPMTMAIDTEAILALPPPANWPRLRYATNTERGSSGSPCLTMDWTLAALHHLGDPNWVAPVFNQGVPAHLIRADIVSAGHVGWLG